MAQVPSVGAVTSTSASKASTASQEYRLKTHVIDVVCPDKDNLYVSAYHTGESFPTFSARMRGVNSLSDYRLEIFDDCHSLTSLIRSWNE